MPGSLVPGFFCFTPVLYRRIRPGSFAGLVRCQDTRTGSRAACFSCPIFSTIVFKAARRPASVFYTRNDKSIDRGRFRLLHGLLCCQDYITEIYFIPYRHKRRAGSDVLPVPDLRQRAGPDSIGGRPGYPRTARPTGDRQPHRRSRSVSGQFRAGFGSDPGAAQ